MCLHDRVLFLFCLHSPSTTPAFTTNTFTICITSPLILFIVVRSHLPLFFKFEFEFRVQSCVQVHVHVVRGARGLIIRIHPASLRRSVGMYCVTQSNISCKLTRDVFILNLVIRYFYVLCKSSDPARWLQYIASSRSSRFARVPHSRSRMQHIHHAGANSRQQRLGQIVFFPIRADNQILHHASANDVIRKGVVFARPHKHTAVLIERGGIVGGSCCSDRSCPRTDDKRDETSCMMETRSAKPQCVRGSGWS